MLVSIRLSDLRSILDREIRDGLHHEDDIERHRRLTVQMMNALQNGVRTYDSYGLAGKIPVIKAHRKFYGSSLREAKEWTEGDFSTYPREIPMEFAQMLEEVGATFRD